jgi:hypothetical protein
MFLPPISDEQRNILQKLKSGNNVIIDSVAGSGKTTTNLYIALENPSSSILLLTYNSKLRIETRAKQNCLGLVNMEVHTYHSFCVKYYDHACYTDIQIIKLLKNVTKTKIPSYDIIVLDETQDMSPLYFELVCKILSDNKTAQLCILGDKNQSIFDFNGADERFITFADKIFTQNAFPWVKCYLNVSFRITSEMALFVNHCMMKKERIKSNKISGIKPKYIICKTHNEPSGYNKVYEEVMKYLMNGYLPQDVFILAPSLRSEKNATVNLENKLKNTKNMNIPIFVPNGDDVKLDDEILKNKLVFSTYHQSKGLERKIVVVYGFDNSYFQFYKKDKNPNVCPNELYVACTRASEHLLLIHDNRNLHLPFLHQNNLINWCDVDIKKKIEKTNKNKEAEKIVTVCDLLRHLPPLVIESCFKRLTLLPIRIGDKINITNKINQCDTFEDVSDINGIAIPSYFEQKITNKIGFFDVLLSSLDPHRSSSEENNLISNKILRENVLLIRKYKNEKCMSPSQILHISNVWNAYKSKYVFKLKQITEYNWMHEYILETCFDRLNLLGIDIHATFEQKCCSTLKKNIQIVGYIDCCDDGKIYEFKCTTSLTPEHYLQLAVYKYLYESESQNKTSKQYYLYNILCDELVELQCDYHVLTEIMSDIIAHKYAQKIDISDQTFMTQIECVHKSINSHLCGII